MIIFEGDFVRRTGKQQWLEVVGIVDDMHIQLSDGAYVEASEQAIGQVLSAQEYLQSELAA